MIQLCDRKRNRLIQPDFATSFLSAKCCGNKISILISISSILLHLGLQVFLWIYLAVSSEGEEKLFGKDFAKNFQEGSLKEFLKRPPSPHSCRKNRQELL